MGGATFRDATEEIETDTAFTGVWRRSRLVELGGWDEGWPVNQDAELAARIRETGGRIVSIPGMAARYVPRNSLSGLGRQYWRYGYYRAKTARHHPVSLRRSHLLPIGLVLSPAVAIAGGRRTGRLGRLGLLLYALALAGATVSSATSEETSAVDLAWLPVVYAVIHASWGAGFLMGCARFGLPTAAMLNQAGIARSGDAQPGK
jgi:hypothetical protein